MEAARYIRRLLQSCGSLSVKKEVRFCDFKVPSLSVSHSLLVPLDTGCLFKANLNLVVGQGGDERGSGRKRGRKTFWNRV